MDKKNLSQKILVGIFILLIIIAGFFFFQSLWGKKIPDGFISVSGRIEADEYNAATKIAGKVERLLVEEGADVNKGQLLAKLYSRQAEAQLESARKEVSLWENRLAQARFSLSQGREQTGANIRQAEANLSVNHSQLSRAQAAYQQNLAQLEQAKIQVKQAELEEEQARASVKKAGATLAYAEKEYERFKNLVKEDAVPKSRFDEVETRFIATREELVLAEKQADKAREAVEVSRKNQGVAEAAVNMGRASMGEGRAAINAGRAGVNLAQAGFFDVRQREEEVRNAVAMLEKARAALASAEADLSDSRVYSPISGRVTTKISEPGEVIAAGTPIFTLIDLDRLYLRVFLPTDKAGKVKIGNSARIQPDALGKETFEGVVTKVADTAEFTPKNVETKEQRAKLVFEVKIKVLNNRDRKLKAGMPAEGWIRFDDSSPWDRVKN